MNDFNFKGYYVKRLNWGFETEMSYSVCGRGLLVLLGIITKTKNYTIGDRVLKQYKN
jgi:hypothetical protein